MPRDKPFIHICFLRPLGFVQSYPLSCPHGRHLHGLGFPLAPPGIIPPEEMDTQQRQFFTPENLVAAISALNIDPEGFFLDGEFRGGQCHIFKLSRPTDAGGDLEKLAVRAPIYMDDVCDTKISALRTELRTLQTLKDKGFPWAPRCRGSSLSFDNAIRHPFVVLTWIDGAALRWDENVPVRVVRDRVLAQMAAIQVSLIECTQQNGTYPSLLWNRAKAHLILRARRGNYGGIFREACKNPPRTCHRG